MTSRHTWHARIPLLASTWKSRYTAKTLFDHIKNIKKLTLVGQNNQWYQTLNYIPGLKILPISFILIIDFCKN